MRYTYYQPVGPMLDRFAGETVTSRPYRAVFSGDVEPVGNVLEELWALHNAGDRPLGKVIRSMSVGDVVDLDGALYTVEPMGFRALTVEETAAFRQGVSK